MDVDAALQSVAVIAAAAAILPIVARRLPVPLPVLLLAVGILAGREGFGAIDVEEIPDLQRLAVTLAVAIIVSKAGRRSGRVRCVASGRWCGTSSLAG